MSVCLCLLFVYLQPVMCLVLCHTERLYFDHSSPLFLFLSSCVRVAVVFFFSLDLFFPLVVVVVVATSTTDAGGSGGGDDALNVPVPI